MSTNLDTLDRSEGAEAREVEGEGCSEEGEDVRKEIDVRPKDPGRIGMDPAERSMSSEVGGKDDAAL